MLKTILGSNFKFILNIRKYDFNTSATRQPKLWAGKIDYERISEPSFTIPLDNTNKSDARDLKNNIKDIYYFSANKEEQKAYGYCGYVYYHEIICKLKNGIYVYSWDDYNFIIDLDDGKTYTAKSINSLLPFLKEKTRNEFLKYNE